MALTPDSVRHIWESITGVPLEDRWHQRFTADPLMTRLVGFSPDVLHTSGATAFRKYGELRLSAWIDEAILLPAKLRDATGAADAASGSSTRASSSRGGKSRLTGQVWSAPADGDLHKRISEIMGDKPDYN